MSTRARRRRNPRPCLLCEHWSTRHPSRICRDCRPVVGPGVVRYSATIEKENTTNE